MISRLALWYGRTQKVREDDMLELYHNINSVCAQKVRIALEEKGQKAEDHIMTLRGDQNEPAYLKLNPKGSCRH